MTFIAPGTITVDTGVSGEFSGPISGAGTITKAGAGTLILSGNNSFSSSPVISSGTLQINQPASFPSALNVTDNGAFVFNNTKTALVSGNITGTGTLAMQGSGVLQLSGANNFTGPTSVQAGTLVIPFGGSLTMAMPLNISSGATALIDGTVSASVNVDVGGILEGTGTVGTVPADVVTVDGTISPGVPNVPIGMLSGANFILAGSSTFQLQMSDTTSDQLAATTNVTIDGGVLQLFPFGFVTPAVTSYTVITGPINNMAPFQLINPLTRYSFSVQYNANSVLLLLNAAPIPFSVLVPTGNAGAVARCFDELVPLDIPDLVPVINILDLMTPSEMAQAFNQMQPANFNNIAFAQENVAERIRQIYTDHFFDERVAACEGNYPWSLWASPFAERARQRGNSNLPGYVENFAGFSAACDYRTEKHWMFTAGFSYASADVDVSGGVAKADFQTYAGSVGGAWTDDAFFADAIFSYLHSPIDAKRKIEFGIVSPALTSEIDRTGEA